MDHNETIAASNRLPAILYRGLRKEEIERGFVLIPKAQKPFLAHPRLPIVLPFVLEERIEYAVREHQWVEPDESDPNRRPRALFETSGVSTTPKRERAVHYASHGIIVRIQTENFEQLGIKALSVAEHVHSSLISEPLDEEIVLVYQDGQPLPREIIVEVIKL